MRKKTNSWISILLWIIAYVFLAFILHLVLSPFISVNSRVLDWISVYGVYTTIYSLVLMFVQFKSIRDVSEETKNKLNKTVAISDLSKYSELIRSVETDVINDATDMALYKTQNIRAIVQKIKMLEDDNGSNEEEYKTVFSILATHIDSYYDQLLSQESTLNKSVILKELEIVSSFFLSKSNEMINNFE